MINQVNEDASMLRFAQLSDLRIAYREGGAGSETVILIHGLCSAILTWRDVFEAVEARRRVIALDLKGYGASDKPRGDYRLEEQAEIVRRLMDELLIERAALVGNSMGGAVALRVAARWPERVTQLVLADPAVYSAHLRSILARLLLRWSGRPGRVTAFRTLRFLMRSPSFIESRMRVIYGRTEAITPEKVAAYYSLLKDPACLRAVVETLQAWDLQPVERNLHLVQQPTLIVWGERDRIIHPRFGRRLLQDLPQAQLVSLPCGHAPQEEMPVEFARLVNNFLQ
jgi:pimeloyl-ACP methyl ester carboxylesterase